MSNKFENLNAWKIAKELVILVYKITDKYPSKELFALTNQTTRAAVSIIANIAEGTSRSSKKDFCHFLEIAIGSAFELETLIIIAHERKYISQEEKNKFDEIVQSTEKLINGLMRSLKQ